ncbi:hypothetical protein ACKWTF_013118 [Chironomus riparius]
MNFLIILSIGMTLSVFGNADQISTTGVWVSWNGSKVGVPANAVVGGFDQDGPYYVARAVHNDRGTVVGKYSPRSNYAHYPYYNEEHRASSFELLTHSNYVWVSKTDPRPLISGGNAQYMYNAWYGDFKIPGKFHIDSCWIPYGGKEHQYKYNFNVLKRA